MTTSSPGWGVPDWLHPEDYPAPKGPSALMEWAWEFLRRNDSFRDFWVNKVEPFIRADGRIGRDATGRFWPYYKEMQETFGISDPRSPRQNSWIPSFCDGATAVLPAPAVSYEALPEVSAPVPGNHFVPPSRANLSKETILDNAKVQLSWFEMGFTIDLRLPLDDQLKVIRKLAEEDQLVLRRAGGVELKTARTSDKYALYLRILDAHDAGAKRSDVADVLFPMIDNVYPECCRLKAYDNARAEARRLRDSGYRAVALRARVPMFDAAPGPTVP
jgi:hypothetical protein